MVDRKNAIKVFPIELETLTPVAVGNGEILSPYTDYVFAGDDIRVLDKKKLAERIAEKDSDLGDKSKKLMDEYIDLIYQEMDNNRSRFNLKKDFIENKSKLGINSAEITHRSHPYFGLNPSINRQNIKCIVKNNNNPYIPGSTIKGAIKGALLYHWFQNDGKKEFNALMKQVNSTYNNVKRKIKEIESIAPHAQNSWQAKKDIKRIKNNIWEYDRKYLDESIQTSIAQLLTVESSFFPMEFNNLKPSDTQLFSSEDIIFQQTNRIHLTQGKVGIPVNTEAIKADLISDFSLGIYPRFKHVSLDFLNKEAPIKALFKRINEFSKDNIILELERLNSLEGFNKAYGKNLVFFKDYGKELTKLKEQLDQVLPNEAIFCLGSGKSFFYNSIGLAILHSEEGKKDKYLFKKFFKLYFLGKDGQNRFPLTRPITDIGEPMGWVKLIWK